MQPLEVALYLIGKNSTSGIGSDKDHVFDTSTRSYHRLAIGIGTVYPKSPPSAALYSSIVHPGCCSHLDSPSGGPEGHSLQHSSASNSGFRLGPIFAKAPFCPQIKLTNLLHIFATLGSHSGRDNGALMPLTSSEGLSVGANTGGSRDSTHFTVVKATHALPP